MESEYSVSKSYRVGSARKAIIAQPVVEQIVKRCDKSAICRALETLLGSSVRSDAGRSYCPTDMVNTKVYYCERYKLVIFWTTDVVNISVGRNGEETYVVATQGRNIDTAAMRIALAVSSILPQYIQTSLIERSRLMAPNERPLAAIVCYALLEDCWQE